MAAAMAQGQVHHAWLIAGAKGLGKATLAYRFARRLLGASQAGTRPLDVAPDDPNARLAAASSHPDLFVLRRGIGDKGKARREITAEEARALGAFFSLGSARDGWRVAIVDCVDDLNRHAANAILKIVEEPPPRSAILLVCNAPGAALATIRSRCRRVALCPQPDHVVSAALGAKADETLLRLANGRPGRAIAFAAQSAGDLNDRLLQGLLALPRKGPLALWGVAFERGGDAGARFALALDLLQDAIRRGVVRALGAEEGRDLSGLSALISPNSAPAWAAAWARLSSLREEWDGLGMDASHAMTRAGAILSQAAGVRG
jgi:DNA polymerase-3 subunit delta'